MGDRAARCAIAMSDHADRERADVRGQRRPSPRRGARCSSGSSCAPTSPCEVIDYPPPQPLPALWARAGCRLRVHVRLSDRDCATAPPPVLAAPVPAPKRYLGMPVYCTDIVVRADAPLAAAAGRSSDAVSPSRRVDSQSGTRRRADFSLPSRCDRGGRLFAGDHRAAGNTQRVSSTRSYRGEADAGPLDSYFHDLLRRHEPALAAQLRTDRGDAAMTPIPPLVAASGLPDAYATRLTAALLAVADVDALAPVRATLLLHGFAAVAADLCHTSRGCARSRRGADTGELPERVRAFLRTIDTVLPPREEWPVRRRPRRPSPEPSHVPAAHCQVGRRRRVPDAGRSTGAQPRSASARRISPSSSSWPRSTRRRSKPRESRSSARSTWAAR